ncbi:MAG: hypothetical protein K2N14_02445, partial [Clostridia bacterium]|nr:hypothetical protein [Clostridia bacterium]
LIGGESAQPEQVSLLAETEEQASADDKLMSLIFSLISTDGWVNYLNNFTLTSDGKSVALGYMSDNAASVEIGADGCLSLNYDGSFGERFSLSGGITVTPVGGTLVGAIEEKLQSVKMSSSKDEGSAEFMRLAYNFLFEAISGIDVSNILGSNTYTVTFALNGANTNIDELKDVFIDAKIYITGQKGEQGKLAEGDLNINANGVVINLNVITERRGDNTHFYINLNQVMDVKLPDLKLLATQDSLYDTIKVIISAVNDTNVLDLLSGLMGSGNDAPAEKVESTKESGAKLDGDTLDLIANIVNKLLDFNFSQAVSAAEADGVTTATIDLDNIVKQLGYKTGALGTVEAVINHNNHSMTTVGKTMVTDENGNSELKGWISLSSELAARKDYSDFDRSEYISIEFLPDLISDIVKTATDDNGHVQDKFTLSGSVNAAIDIKVYKININLDITTLTVNLNGENGLYFSLIANLSGNFVTTRTIGLTYQNGYLTLGRNLNTQSPEYRVMTFDYFLEMMFDSDGEKSTLNWLLGIGDFVWGIAGPAIKDSINMDTGLTTPEQVYLYNGKAQKAEEEISMYSYVDALKVIVNGNTTAKFGTDSSLSALENDLG